MMAVSAAISEQAASLGVSILIGGALFLLYDIFRIFRRVVPHGNFWIGVEDFFYWLCCTAVVFVMLYRENDGMVRGFSIGGIMIGMLLYYFLLSRFVIRINVMVFGTVFDHQSLPERSGIHAAGGVASETVRGRNRKGRTAEQL